MKRASHVRVSRLVPASVCAAAIAGVFACGDSATSPHRADRPVAALSGASVRTRILTRTDSGVQATNWTVVPSDPSSRAARLRAMTRPGGPARGSTPGAAQVPTPARDLVSGSSVPTTYPLRSSHAPIRHLRSGVMWQGKRGNDSLSLAFADDPIGNPGLPPDHWLLYKNGHLAIVVAFKFKKTGRGWRASGGTKYDIDADGNWSTATEFERSDPSTARARTSAFESAVDVLAVAVSSLLPAKLGAQDPGSCMYGLGAAALCMFDACWACLAVDSIFYAIDCLGYGGGGGCWTCQTIWTVVVVACWTEVRWLPDLDSAGVPLGSYSFQDVQICDG